MKIFLPLILLSALFNWKLAFVLLVLWIGGEIAQAK